MPLGRNKPINNKLITPGAVQAKIKGWALGALSTLQVGIVAHGDLLTVTDSKNTQKILALKARSREKGPHQFVMQEQPRTTASKLFSEYAARPWLRSRRKEGTGGGRYLPVSLGS